MMLRKLQMTAILLATAFMLAACGDHLIRGVSPVVRINEISHDGKTINLQLSLRNRNGVEMDVESMNFVLNVEDQAFFAYDGPASTNIVANGTETWTVDIKETEANYEKLNALENGDIKSIPYSFKGKLTSTEAGTLDFEHEGHLYPVPGRPGRFR